jgi:hypothetical protein
MSERHRHAVAKQLPVLRRRQPGASRSRLVLPRPLRPRPDQLAGRDVERQASNGTRARGGSEFGAGQAAGGRRCGGFKADRSMSKSGAVAKARPLRQLTN